MKNMGKYTSYEEQVADLRENPSQIFEQWSNAIGIFAILASNQMMRVAGCPTLIRGSVFSAYVGEQPHQGLTHKIRYDERIPKEGRRITIEHLEIFMELQKEHDHLTELFKQEEKY